MSDSDGYYSATNNILSITIGITLAIFTGKLYDLSNNYKEIKDKCKDIKYDNISYDSCHKEQQELEKVFNKSRFNTMLLAGFIYVVLGIVLTRQHKNTSLMGLVLCGFLIIIYNVFMNWKELDEGTQLMLLGGIITGLFVTGIVINNNVKLNYPQ